MLSYPANFEPAEEGGFVVTFPISPRQLLKVRMSRTRCCMPRMRLKRHSTFILKRGGRFPHPPGQSVANIWSSCLPAFPPRFCS